MKIGRLNKRFAGKVVTAVLLAVISAPPVSGMAADYGTQVASVTVDIGNRMYPSFRQQIQTKMNTREQIGDTDFFFEVIEFYPHFTFVDSTKQILSLSDEPKNAAFKIRVYDEDGFVENTWAFFSLDVPHFSPKSYLTFHVVSFDYRGETYRNAENKNNDND